MKLVEKISLSELRAMAEAMYDNLVKAVVDVNKELMVVDAGLHSDEEAFLLELGSQPFDLWGINLYPDLYGTDNFIEYDSMINIRPAQHNRSRNIGDENIRRKIAAIVESMVYE